MRGEAGREADIFLGPSPRRSVREGVAFLSDTISDKQAKLQEQIEHLGAWDVAPIVEQAMDAQRCPPGEVIVDNLSGGERRRVALARS